MYSTSSRLISAGMAAALLAACGGGSAGGSNGSSALNPAQPSTLQSVNVPLMISDASSEDWATIGVKVLSIALVPQGGGGNVTVYTAPTPAPIVNLVELDQIAELLGNVTVPVGTYGGAVLTVSGNPGDILLTAASNPEAGFAGTPGAMIPANQIQVMHTEGSGSSVTVPVKVSFVSPLLVSTTQNNALDLEFDLSHPAFLVGHVPPAAGGTTIWAVNFDGPVRHHPVRDLAGLVLRHMYGDVQSVSQSSITILKEFPTEPAANPESAVAGAQALQISVDSNYGTIVYDVDAQSHMVVKDFSAETDLKDKFVRIAARYQEDGTLIATRIWASSQFSSVWLSPEGHVLHVDAVNAVLTIENEQGRPVPVTVDADTQFYFRAAQNPAADSSPIGSGPAFLGHDNLVRGFKVHANVVDAFATPLVAQSIDIETARYDGVITSPSTSGFTYTRTFRSAVDDYVYTLGYIADGTANGFDMNNVPVSGYKWWNFAYPTLLMSDTSAITDFVSATDGSVNFGGTVGPVPSYGVSYATWNGPAAAGAWSAAATVLLPSLLPLGAVTGILANNAFMMSVVGGTMPATVDVSTTPGSATLVYQVDCTNGVLSVNPIDITTGAGMTALTNALSVGAPVKVYGIPQANDAGLKAYVITYFTGQPPAQ